MHGCPGHELGRLSDLPNIDTFSSPSLEGVARGHENQECLFAIREAGRGRVLYLVWRDREPNSEDIIILISGRNVRQPARFAELPLYLGPPIRSP